MSRDNGLESVERADQFHSTIIPHPLLSDAAQLVLQRVINGPYPIIIVLGPAGVGKTKGLIPAITSELSIHPTKNTGTPGHIPVITVRAPAQSRRIFKWSTFFRRFLEAGKHPLVHKIPDRELEQAFINLIKNRRPIALIVDEAQHFTNVTPRSVAQQLDYLKDLIADLDVKLVLVGNYELRNYAFANDQIGRRNSTVVHFARYRLKRTKQEVQDETGKFRNKDIEGTQFRDTLFSLRTELPIETTQDLEDNWKYFYHNSLGCIGILKDWLEESLRNALSEGHARLDLDYIKKFAPSAQKLNALWSPLENIEDQVDESCKSLEELGIETPKGNEVPRKSEPRKAGNEQPGKRKPVRDRAGDEQRNSS